MVGLSFKPLASMLLVSLVVEKRGVGRREDV